MLVTKANASEEGTTSITWLYHQHNQSIHMADGVTVISLSAGLQHKTKTPTDCVGQIVLKQ